MIASALQVHTSEKCSDESFHCCCACSLAADLARVKAPAVFPPLSIAPCLSKISSQAGRPFLRVHTSAVSPLVDLKLMSVPAAIRASTTGARPCSKGHTSEYAVHILTNAGSCRVITL